jgi:hypothetical protein
MPRRELHTFPSEAALCAAFIGTVGPAWVVYPETGGWDILLVRRSDGFQIGIQAKLRCNALVITQALEEWGAWHSEQAGPDCRAILVPDGAGDGFGTIAAYLGLTIIKTRPRASLGGRTGFYSWPSLPESGQRPGRDTAYWHEWAPSKRHRLPEYVPDVAAGASAPIRLTEWKVKALKIAVTIERRGYVTKADFRHLGLDPRRWMAPGQRWLVLDGAGYRSTDRMPKFKEQHPRVYDEIAADAGKWMLPQLELQITSARRRTG